jgi:hypothetical protein
MLVPWRKTLEKRMTKILAAATSMFLFIAAANGQTAADLAKKYHHHEVYEVEPGVQMTPKFDSSGAVCEMQVEQAHFVKDGVDVSHGVDERQVYPIIDELVPVSERGTKLNTFDECVEDIREMFFKDGIELAFDSLSRIKHRVLFSFPEFRPQEEKKEKKEKEEE